MNNYIWIGLDKLKYLINQLKSKFMSNVNPTGTGSLSLNRKADTTIGINSVAVGTNVEASGDNSHAEGSVTTASGSGSHAEGSVTTASGSGSHAEGHYTIASGIASHAEGSGTTASGSSSHAEGLYSKAIGNYSHVEGKFNIEDMQNKYAHIIGNGTNNNYRSNAFTVDWDGKVEAQSDVVANKDSATPISLVSLNNPTFTEASARTNINTGESISTIFGKIKKWFSDLKPVATSGKYSDLENDFIYMGLLDDGTDINNLNTYPPGEGIKVMFRFTSTAHGTLPFPDGYIITYIWRNMTGLNNYLRQIAYEDNVNSTKSRYYSQGSGWSNWVSCVYENTETTNKIIRKGGGTYILDRNNVAISGESYGQGANSSYNPVCGQKTNLGYWSIGNLSGSEDLIFNYTTDANFASGINSSNTVRLSPPYSNGEHICMNNKFSGVIYAGDTIRNTLVTKSAVADGTAGAGLSFWYTQNADDSPAKNNVSIVIIMNPVATRGSWSTLWVLTGAHLWYYQCGATPPTSISWTQIR